MKWSKWLLLLGFSVMCFAAGGAATKSKMQLIYRGDELGNWQVYIFGAACPANKLHIVSAGNDGSDPIKLACTVEK